MIHRWLQKTVNGDVLGSHKFGLAAAMIVLSLIDDVKLIELKGLNFSTVELELEKKHSAGTVLEGTGSGASSQD